MAILNRDTTNLTTSATTPLRKLSFRKMPLNNGANLPARLFEEYDNVSFLVSRLRIPVSLGDLVQ